MQKLSGRFSHFWHTITIFVAGATTLALEFCVSRLVQSFYGASNIVWANVIGLTLTALTCGYLVGGRIADRFPQHRHFYQWVTLSGVLSLLSFLLSSGMLRLSATGLADLQLGDAFASFAIVNIALFLPVTALGAITPYGLRLMVDDVEQSGRVSGRLYAISTLGSLAGTYLSVLVGIPFLGTRMTALLFGGALTLVGLIGWARSLKTVLVIIMATFGLLAINREIGRISSPNLIIEKESAYNAIRVVQRKGCYVLLLNEGVGEHSIACPNGELPTSTIWHSMGEVPKWIGAEAPQRIAIVGLAGGSMAERFWSLYPNVVIDGIELDDEIIKLGRIYFHLDHPNLNIHSGDGRYQLSRLPLNSYDWIILDAYRVPYIPWHLTTREFFAELPQHLKKNGGIAINVGRTTDDRRLIAALTHTLQTTFPTIHTIDIPNSFNTILIATLEETTLTNIDPALGQLMPNESSAILFTDDRAPVETLVDSIVVQYFWQGETSIFGRP